MSAPTYTSTSALGAASELIASAHLMAQGYHVFRSVAPSCPVDLVAYRGDELLRVEVKSLHVSQTNRKTPGFPNPTNDHWDLLVVVLPTGGAFTLKPRETYAELRADFLAAIEPLGLVRSFRGRRPNGGRRYKPDRYRRVIAHLVDADAPYGTSVCGLNVTGWPGEDDATERAAASALPLCKVCAQFVEEAA